MRLTELHWGTNRSSSLKASESKGSILDPLKRNKINTICINESGLYSLILRSKLESASVFKRWVTKEVLPSIRKTGKYSYNDMNHKYNGRLTFKIKNETDLHTKVERYPYSIFTATSGENQDSSKKRIEYYRKEYLRGCPDLIINNLHKYYTGLAIEFKSPKGNGVLSDDQSKMLRQYQNNGFKTLISNFNDYRYNRTINYIF